jgi:predicted phage tail protein
MQSKRGQIIASILVGLLIASGTYLGSLGMNAVASIVFGTTILSVGATFVAGKISQAKDLKSKLEKEA